MQSVSASVPASVSSEEKAGFRVACEMTDECDSECGSALCNTNLRTNVQPCCGTVESVLLSCCVELHVGKNACVHMPQIFSSHSVPDYDNYTV